MGPSSIRGSIQVGLGVSALSFTGNQFRQNERVLNKYLAQIKQNSFSKERFHEQSEEEVLIESIIDTLCTQFKISNPMLKKGDFSDMLEDKILNEENDTLFITEKGRHFLKAIAFRVIRILKLEARS